MSIVRPQAVKMSAGASFSFQKISLRISGVGHQAAWDGCVVVTPFLICPRPGVVIALDSLIE